MPDGDLNIFRKKNQHPSIWAGGTTTQLYIYPPESDYAKRDFLFRISTATTEKESSTFTHLPGIKRVLMVLKGKLTINHKNHYTKTLNPFESDSFEGDWETSAEGKVTDFNVLFKPEVTAQINTVHLKANQLTEIMATGNAQFGYVVNGSCELLSGGKKETLNESDFVTLPKLNPNSIIAIMDCTFILIEVNIHNLNVNASH